MIKRLGKKIKKLISGAMAVAVAAASVNWSFISDLISIETEAYNVTYKYFEINFDDPSRLNGDPFYLYTQDGVQGCEIQNGVLVKNGRHPIFGLSMYEKYGDQGKLTTQFDLRAARGAGRNAPWNTVYVGLRQPTDQATGYMSGGIWLSLKDDTIGFRFNTWALTTEMKVPINISDRRHKIYIEDDQDTNRINIWVDDTHEATLVISEPSTISIYNSAGQLVETQEVAHEITKGGYVSWWAHDLEIMEMDNVKVWMPNVDTTPYVPVDASRIQDTYMDTWVAVDDLGRLSPTYDEVGGVDEEKMVGMFYFLTHDGYSSDATDHYAAYQSGGIDGVWNSLSRTGEHFWGKPYFGYYRSDDEWVIRKHATMMVEAGVDFIFFDCSNNILYPGVTNKILETYREMREEGLQTPQVMWFLNDREDFTANSLHRLYDEIYKDGKYSDLWVMWEGKPLIMVNPNGADSSVPMEFFTIRRSWAFESYGPYQQAGGKGFWQWADVFPQVPGYSLTGELEQMVVMSGFWANGNGGRSNTTKYPYHSTEKTSYPRILGNNFEMHRVENGVSAEGAGYQEQFDYALQVDPPVLLLVGWNEWKAGSQGLTAGMGQDIANTYVIDGAAPHYQFTDCFNPEFARDIEPMTGGYTDAFYYQTVNNVREFEGVRKIPTNNDAVSINIDAGFEQWNAVQTEYYDTPNDTYHRNMISAYLEGRYTNTTGRNDLRTAKVAYDNDNVYFYINTKDNITAAEGTNWMNLFIDADNNSSTGWKGYDLLINRSRNGSKVSVEKSIGNGWNWQNIGWAEYRVDDNQMMIALPNSLSNLNVTSAFDFKWADNSTTDGTVEQFMDLGDTAPDNRFNFRVVRNTYALSDEAFNHLGSFTVNMAIDSTQAFLGYQKVSVPAPFKENGVTYVPLETVTFNQDVEYSFDGTTATIKKIEDILTFRIGSSTMNTNQGAWGSFDTAMPGTAKIVNNTVYVPLETAAYALERNYYTNGNLIQLGGDGIVRANASAAQNLLEELEAGIILDAELDGVYYIKSANSGKYLDVAFGSADNNANIQQWSFNGTSGQQFKLVSDGNGYYSILTGASNYTKSVDVDNWSTDNGANIIQWEYHGGDCQKFQFEKNGDFYIIKTKVSGNDKCLDVDNAGTDDGSNVHQWDIHGNAWQQWILEPVSESVPEPDPVPDEIAEKWIFREANNADAYVDRINGDTIYLDWNNTALRGIISKEVYSNYELSAQIKKGSSSYWTSIQLGLPQDDRLDMWENLNGGSLIGGTGLQIAISDTKAVVGLVNGVENTDTTQVEVNLNGINTTSNYVTVNVKVKGNVYEIMIGSQLIATVTFDESSVEYGRMELRREWVNGVLTPAYADSDIAYYSSGVINANGTDTYFSNKAVAVTNPETGDGTFGFSTRAEAFWVSNVNITEITVNEPAPEEPNPGLSSVEDGVYYLKNTYSGKYLDVSGASADNGANIQQWSYNGSDAQKFRIVSDGNGYYSILTGASGYTKAIDVDSWSTDNGTNIIQWAYHGGDCQKFSLENVNGAYVIQTKVTDSGKCLDVEGPSTSDGANVHQWDCYGASNQTWILEPVTGHDNNGSSDSGIISDDATDNDTVLEPVTPSVSYVSLFEGEKSGSGWAQVVSVDTTRAGGSFNPSDIMSNGYFYVEYSGVQDQLELIIQSWSGGSNWGKITISESGTVNNRYYAKFSYSDCVAIFGSDNFAGMLDRVHVGALNDSLTVYSLRYYSNS